VLVSPDGAAHPYSFELRSDETPTIPMTFPLPPPGKTTWQVMLSPNGTQATYHFAPGSTPASARWEVDAEFRNPRYDVQKTHFAEHYSLDPMAGRLLAWSARGDYQEGAWIWNTTTATFEGERTVPATEWAQITHDSELLVRVMGELMDLEDQSDDPGDIDAYRKKLEALKVEMAALPGEIQNPVFTEDGVFIEPKGLDAMLASATEAAKKNAPLLNQPSPDWSAQDLAGHTHSLKDYRGKIVLLDFWAHTCGPCLLSVPYLNKIERDYASRPVEVVGVNAGDGPEDMRRAIAKMGMTNTQLVGRPVTGVYPWSGLPMYLLIDANGIVRARHIGWDDSLDPVLRGEIDHLLQAMQVK